MAFGVCHCAGCSTLMGQVSPKVVGEDCTKSHELLLSPKPDLAIAACPVGTLQKWTLLLDCRCCQSPFGDMGMRVSHVSHMLRSGSASVFLILLAVPDAFTEEQKASAASPLHLHLWGFCLWVLS